MTEQLIGRVKEQAVLEEALQSPRAELVSVIGRRRVGKTFLIRTKYADHIQFELAGIQNAPLKEQLKNFGLRLNRHPNSKRKFETPKDWLEAFYQLMDFLEGLPNEGKKVIFFDELPWLATRRSGFLRAFGVFWNSWASVNKVVVVICGSAASWMIKKVVNNKGGLHNRITKRIYLKPFNLYETAIFLKSNHVILDHYQIVQLYMAMGGIPHYLKEVKPGQSAVQSIEEICFGETGLLTDEFSRLYPSLFEDADNHIAIIRTLAEKPNGLNRKSIIAATKLSSGGTVTRTLQELEQSGFITAYFHFSNKKNVKTYRLTDEYSLFYLKFIERQQLEGDDVWQRLSQTQSYKTWTGYAYENIALKHLGQIKKKLGISGVHSNSSTFYKKGSANQKGVQIDLLIDRNDHVINLCEVKFYNTPFSIDKAFADNLRDKMGAFQQSTQTSKQLFWTLITTFNLKHNQYSLGLIQQVVTLEDLFVA